MNGKHQRIINTRGDTVLMTIFEIVVVLVVVGGVFGIANNYSNSATMKNVRYTKDLGLMINTLIATPGNALVEFPYNTTGLTFILTNQEIKGKNMKLNEEEVLPLRLPQGYSATGSTRGDSICLMKITTKLFLGDCHELKKSSI